MNGILKLFVSCSFLFGDCCFALQHETETQLSSFFEKDQICSGSECYTVLKKLGSGFFSEVFAVENSNGEQFALKTFKIFEDPKFSNHVLADSKREFSVGQSLEHPNIIKSYDLFSAKISTGETQKNLVLQLVKGQALFDVEKGSLSRWEALNAAITMCNALKYAYSRGLMHCDLHPNNIMLNDNLEVMVIDLASFLTNEEVLKMFGFFLKNSPDMTLASPSLSKESLRESESEERDILKLEQFFAMKPNLIELMQQMKVKIDHHEFRDKSRSFEPTLRNYQKRGIVEDSRNTLGLINFDTISQSCVDIVMKTDLSRDEKFELRAQIKKIFWHYEEDLNEKKCHAFEHYLDKLIMFLQNEF
ncbi:MAG: protein kinase [Parachlamydiaceae bacterium]|nr:protein kinase [Parachlamydiaceae bacterium]